MNRFIQGYVMYERNEISISFVVKRRFADGAEELDLQSKELSLMESAIVSQLEKGRLVVLIVGPGDFTEHGHYLLVVGYEDGLFRINDPNSIIRSETLWSYERLEPQIRNLWAIWA